MTGRIEELAVTPELYSPLTQRPGSQACLYLNPTISSFGERKRGTNALFRNCPRDVRGPVFNYVLRMVGDQALAEDLTQEIFLRIYQELPGFSLSAAASPPGLFQIAKNRVLDELRAPRGRKPSNPIVNIDDLPPLEVVDAPPERTEVIDAVWRAVGFTQPRPEDGAAAPGRVGLSYTEIADSLEITLATVKWRIFKGARRGAARARARGHRGRDLAPARPSRDADLNAPCSRRAARASE